MDGQIEFDNNLTENAIRPTKLGHKNWMFIGGEHTGWRSAVIYTFVEQVRRHGADPFAYFEWVFEKLMYNPSPEELEALLPVNWIKTRLPPLSDHREPGCIDAIGTRPLAKMREVLC